MVQLFCFCTTYISVDIATVHFQALILLFLLHICDAVLVSFIVLNHLDSRVSSTFVFIHVLSVF